jgi:hypothetical protein
MGNKPDTRSLGERQRARDPGGRQDSLPSVMLFGPYASRPDERTMKTAASDVAGSARGAGAGTPFPR